MACSFSRLDLHAHQKAITEKIGRNIRKVKYSIVFKIHVRFALFLNNANLNPLDKLVDHVRLT